MLSKFFTISDLVNEQEERARTKPGRKGVANEITM